MKLLLKRIPDLEKVRIIKLTVRSQINVDQEIENVPSNSNPANIEGSTKAAVVSEDENEDEIFLGFQGLLPLSKKRRYNTNNNNDNDIDNNENNNNNDVVRRSYNSRSSILDKVRRKRIQNITPEDVMKYLEQVKTEFKSQ